MNHCSGKQRISKTVWLSLILITGLSPLAAADISADSDDIALIDNLQPPPDGTAGYTTTQLWRRGGDEDELLFGVISKVVAGPDGTIYLLDSQLSQVIAISPDGGEFSVIAREGDGPGETRQPADLFLHPGGGLCIVQPFPGKLIQIRGDGTPDGEILFGGDGTAGGFNILQRGTANAGRLALGGISISYTNDGSYRQRNFFTLCKPGGGQIATCFETSRTTRTSELELDEGGSDFPFDRFAMGSDGRFYLATRRNDYHIVVYDPNGKIERIIEKPYQSLKRTATEKQLARNTQEAYGRYFPSPPQSISVEATHADITGLFVAANDELWVRTSRGDLTPPPGSSVSYDVFDPAGHFRRQVTIQCPHKTARDHFYLLPDNRLVVVTGGVSAALALQGVVQPGTDGTDGITAHEVICYRLDQIKTAE